jgi:hypothetical protein
MKRCVHRLINWKTILEKADKEKCTKMSNEFYCTIFENLSKARN